MQIRVMTLSIGAMLVLSACASTTPTLNMSDPQVVANSITVERDNFKKITRYEGPNVTAGLESGLSGLSDTVLIRAWKQDKTGEISYQIYINDYFEGDWRMYDSTYDANGNNLETIKITHDIVTCVKSICSGYESIGVNISREYLEKNKASGIQLKISGNGGENTFSIPGGYIDGVLSVVK